MNLFEAAVTTDTAATLARLSLEGLALGDALGKALLPNSLPISQRLVALPPGPWPYTDDTVMARSIVRLLIEHGRISGLEDDLATAFAKDFQQDTERGYGAGAYGLLWRLAEGESWRDLSPAMFSGQGSMGNGSAMRVAPLGAFFHDDLQRLIKEATSSSKVTHNHDDGIAGAVAVALAAALAQRRELDFEKLAWISQQLLPGPTRQAIDKASRLSHSNPKQAMSALGAGQKILSSDTVPFALWCAAKHPNDGFQAMKASLECLSDPESDRDTICAIVAGIVVLSAGKESFPKLWWDSREKLGMDHF